jgi:hypothetical protein
VFCIPSNCISIIPDTNAPAAAPKVLTKYSRFKKLTCSFTVVRLKALDKRGNERPIRKVGKSNERNNIEYVCKKESPEDRKPEAYRKSYRKGLLSKANRPIPVSASTKYNIVFD